MKLERKILVPTMEADGEIDEVEVDELRPYYRRVKSKPLGIQVNIGSVSENSARIDYAEYELNDYAITLPKRSSKIRRLRFETRMAKVYVYVDKEFGKQAGKNRKEFIEEFLYANVPWFFSYAKRSIFESYD